MKNFGKVISVEENMAIVSVVRKGSCGENCAMCNGCTNKLIEVKAYSDLDVKPGDRVEIESRSGYIYLCLFLVFVLPIVLPLLIYVALVSISKTLAVILSSTSVFAVLSVIFFLSKFKPFLKKITPNIINITNN